MSFINWNSVLEGMKPVFCLIILADCLAHSHFILECDIHYIGGFPGGSVVKNAPANAGDTGDAGLIPALGRSPPLEEQIATHFSILAWEIP